MKLFRNIFIEIIRCGERIYIRPMKGGGKYEMITTIRNCNWQLATDFHFL